MPAATRSVSRSSLAAWFQAEISRDARGDPLGVQVELGRELGQALAGRLGVQRDLPAEQVWWDAAEHQVRVGDGGFGAAGPVADRARVGAGRAGTGLERPLGRDPGDRAAAGADRDDVDHRDLGRVLPDHALGGERRLPVHHHGHVGRGASAIQGEHGVVPGVPGDERRAERARGRAGQHGGDRLVDDLLGGEHAAVGLHDPQRHARADLVQAAADVRHVAGDLGLDRGVHQRGDRALVPPVLPQHVRADRHHGLRVLAPQDLPHPVLVRRVGVGVQEAHADRVDAAVAEPPGDPDRLLGVERADLLAPVVQPLFDGLHQVDGHDAGRLDPEVRIAVPVWHALPGDLQHELVPLGGDEAQPAHLTGEELVGGDRGAVADRLHARSGPAELVEDLAHTSQEALGRVGRGGRCLGGHQPAGLLVEGDHVGEGAAGVDTDADASGHASSGAVSGTPRNGTGTRCTWRDSHPEPSTVANRAGASLPAPRIRFS